VSTFLRKPGALRTASIVIATATALLGSAALSAESASADEIIQPLAPVASPTSNLTVTQAVDVAQPVAGGSTPAHFTVTVGNAALATDGTHDDTAVLAAVTVPRQLHAATVTYNHTVYPVVAGIAEVQIGALAVGTTATIEVSGQVDAATPAATVILNTVDVTGANTETDTADNTSTAQAVTTVSTTLTVTNVAAAASIPLGTAAAIEITVGNTGPSTASNVHITVTVPKGLTAATTAGTFDAATGIWILPTVAQNSAQKLEIAGTPTALGVLKAKAVISAGSYGNISASSTVSVHKVAVIADPKGPKKPVRVTKVSSETITATDPTLAFTGNKPTGGDVLLGLLLLVSGLALIGTRRLAYFFTRG
jgi:hypothetical protein